MCNCQYSEDFIDGGQFFCPSSRKQIIYQAILLKTSGKTAEEIRNTTQVWVLMKPVLTVSGKSYQLDPYCSVVIRDVGDTSCDVISHDAESSNNEIIYGISGGILLIVAVVIIFTLCIVIWMRARRTEYR